MAGDFTLRFWGVRGSIPMPQADALGFGGETSCLEVVCGGRRIIIDAGSGLRRLGQAIGDPAAVSADLLFTHTHLDHILGLPFFPPVYRAEADLRLWAGHLPPGRGIRDAVGALLDPMLLPITPQAMAGIKAWNAFEPGDRLDLGDGILVATAALHHPGGAVGYRIEWRGRSACVVFDHEEPPGKPSPEMVRFCHRADLIVFDSTWTDAEYPQYRGWGHSTWQQAVRLAQAAGAKRAAVFHHAPGRTDAELQAIEAEASALFPGALVAREGMILAL